MRGLDILSGEHYSNSPRNHVLRTLIEDAILNLSMCKFRRAKKCVIAIKNIRKSLGIKICEYLKSTHCYKYDLEKDFGEYKNPLDNLEDIIIQNITTCECSNKTH